MLRNVLHFGISLPAKTFLTDCSPPHACLAPSIEKIMSSLSRVVLLLLSFVGVSTFSLKSSYRLQQISCPTVDYNVDLVPLAQHTGAGR